VAVEFRVLGPVEVVSGGSVVAVGAQAQCAVLAALVVDAGRLVPVEVLVDRVWGSDPPLRARRTLQTYLTRVRRLLERVDGEAARLVNRSGGYVLEVDPDRVDLHRFRRLLDQARDPGCGGRRRAALLGEVLGLWRGEPLAGVSSSWAARLREGLWQQRQDAILLWAQAQLDVGDPAVAVLVLSDLAGEHPLVEPVTAALMRALHAAGRGPEALERYSSIRKQLVEELGVDPGAELQAVHQAVLRGEPDHAGFAPSSPARRATVVPAQLPADVSGFAGRGEHLAWLDTLLSGAATQPPAAVVISAVSGTAGVGKTALAVHWAHRVADRFPDGQLYVNLRGFDPSGQVMAPAEAVRRFLDALEVPPERIPVDLDAQAALYRSLLAGKRMLVVLDNARDTAQVRPLLPGAPTCLVVVTSRNQLTGLIAADGAHPVTLDLLTDEEARQLLARRLGADRVAAEPEAVAEIIIRCARLPLALALVAARAAVRPRGGLGVLAEQLRDAGHRWQLLTGDDPTTDVRAVLSWSYQALTPAAARLFRLLGLHPGPDLAEAAMASLAGLPAGMVRPVLAELTQASLLLEHTPGRYVLHDLLRAYASDLTRRLDPDQQRHTATHRILDHYLHTAHTANRLLDPAREPINLTPPAPGVAPQHAADYQQALDWFTVERPVLLAAVDHAAATGLDTHTWQLAWILRTFLDRRGHWHDWAAAGRAAVAAAHRLADPTAQARAHRHLALAYIHLHRIDDAHTQLSHALDLAAQTGNQTTQARIHNNLSYLWERRGNYPQALNHARQALTMLQATGHQRGQAVALNGVGWCHALLGDHQQALTTCQQALTLCQELGDRAGQAATWDSIGYAHHHLGHHTHAITSYQHALTLYRGLGDRYYEATTLTHLGDTHHATGNHHAAHDAWQQALTILDDLAHPDADQIRTKLADFDTSTDEPADQDTHHNGEPVG
jgi:DNA-binding SARP family transcriptional activator/tetratricopeptide (TPR) repeat protein